jgi:hypothetical protein
MDDPPGAFYVSDARVMREAILHVAGHGPRALD